MRLNLGSAGLTRRGLKVTYKQIAIALVTVVFASPIYTHSVKSRVSTGSLVKMEQLSPELVTQRQASGYEWVATLLAR
jgi:ABC-type Zn2+ transport system substrate-binding protein/surface adhesin